MEDLFCTIGVIFIVTIFTAIIGNLICRGAAIISILICQGKINKEEVNSIISGDIVEQFRKEIIE